MSWAIKFAHLSELAGREDHGMTVREFVGAASARGVSCYAIQLAPNAAFPANYHKAAEEIVFVTRGTARTKVGAEEFDLRPGNLIYIPPGTHHSIVAGPEGFEAFTVQSPAIGAGRDIYFPDGEGQT
jgi:quercetin dioxygenase-like cupin family protein